ncbi:MAG: virulence factor TspB C-terminal domain-related protein [Proteobacteria bacterium]|nr:virulence factor TspB C-terminal domain-related protein [Pseudomonadota bacterium]
MNQALAASFGGWTITNTVAQGASTILTGSKEVILNGAKKIATGTATITPTASQVAKVLARGAAGYALSVAVEQLLGAVSWVLDPENNQIVYTNPNENGEPPITQTGQYLFKNGQGIVVVTGNSLNEICKNIKSQWADSSSRTYIIDWSNSSQTTSGYNCRMHLGDPSNYWNFSGTIVGAQPVDPADEEKKTLPLETVAEQVISNAEGNDVTAQEATTAAAADIINEAENDNVKARPIVQQLENTQSIPTDQTAEGESVPKESENTGDSTAEPVPQDITLDFPIFCDWAPSVCQAANEVIALPITLTHWWETGKTKAESWAQSINEAWTATKEWMNEEETPEQTTEVEIDQTVPVVPDNQYFNWGAYCPFTPGSQTISLEDTNAPIDYDLTSWCDMATEIRPFVLVAGALMSFLIASGIIMGRDD